jgi:hypothetical protein
MMMRASEPPMKLRRLAGDSFLAVPNIVFSILMRKVKSSDRRLIRPSQVESGRSPFHLI